MSNPLHGAQEVKDAILSSGKSKIFTTVEEQRRQKIKELEAEAEKLKTKISIKDLHTESVAIKNERDQIEQQLSQEPQSEFLIKKLARTNERYQVLKDTLHVLENLKAQLEQHIKVEKEYLEDPNFQEYRRNIIAEKSMYSYQEFQNIYREVLDKQQRVESLKEQEKNTQVGLENRKRVAAATTAAYEQEKEAWEQEEKIGPAFGLSPQERIALQNLVEQLYHDRHRLDELRIQELRYRQSFLQTKLFIARSKLEVLKEVFKRVKQQLRIAESEVALARDKFKDKKSQSYQIRDQYMRALEELTTEQRMATKALEMRAKQLNIELGSDIDDWSRKPKNTIASYLSLYEIAHANDYVLLLKRRKDLLSAQLRLEDKKLDYEQVLIEVRDTFHKLINNKFLTESSISQEMKKYQGMLADAKADITQFTEQQQIAADMLAHQKQAVENIKKNKERLQKQRTSLFKGSAREYALANELLIGAQQRVNAQIDTINKLISTNADSINVAGKTTKQIDFILSELEGFTIWRRPEHAISWEGVQNILPDIRAFAYDIWQYGLDINLQGILNWFKLFYHNPLMLGWFIGKLLLVVIALLLIHFYLPTAIIYIQKVPAQGYPLMRWTALLIVCFLEFIMHYFILIALWLLTLTGLYFSETTDPYLYILFYLISIPYLLYLAYRFIDYLGRFNERHNHYLLNKDYQQRFLLIVSTLLYASIAILFFREAFILGNYRKSELRDILLAINFIIVQVSLIFLITKEQILNLITTKNEWWAWIHEQVDRYYYLILGVLIAIIVMSNPYVGFGQYVRYVLWRVFCTALLIRLLIWVHVVLKRSSSRVFFSSEGQVTKERFSYAKTWYGLSVIGIFLLFTTFGIIFVAKIWGWPEPIASIDSWHDISSWLQAPLTGKNVEPPISIYTILQIIGFIIGGFVVAFWINRFVLGKIFDILLVDVGVQNTVSSLARYLIIIIACIIGFQQAGLGSFVIFLVGGLAVGIGWVIKDPISDVVAYFIILVQRPIKIGDFVRIEEGGYQGVVRRISPRSVVLRQKNSTTIIIPNMMILSKPIINWNYVRGFVAFNDILLTVPYKEDPKKVREILLKVLDESPYILKNPKPVVRLDSFGDSGFVFMMRGFLSSNYTLDLWDIASNVRISVVEALRKHNIRIAVPVRVMIGQPTAMPSETIGSLGTDIKSDNT